MRPTFNRCKVTSMRVVWPLRPSESAAHENISRVALTVVLLTAGAVTCGCSGNDDGGISPQVAAVGVDRSPDAVKSVASAVSASRANQARSLPQSLVQSERSDLPGIPTPARVYPPDEPSLSGCCHILLYYGLGPTDLPSLNSGELALESLTDERTAIASFGKSPFVRTRRGVRYLLSNDPIFHSDVGEAHRDQCLATFAALGLPLETPITLEGRQYSVTDLLSESMANFSFDQRELAWSALAYTKYLPPKKEWVSRFGERTSFSQLANHLIHRDPNTESCAGTHIFQALVQIDVADADYRILDDETRSELDAFLTTTLDDLTRRQHEDGSWDWRWSDSINDTDSLSPFAKNLLVTGHLAEVLLFLDSRRRPAEGVYLRAAKWLQQSLGSTEIDGEGSWICPYTHAARVVRGIRVRPID